MNIDGTYRPGMANLFRVKCQILPINVLEIVHHAYKEILFSKDGNKVTADV